MSVTKEEVFRIAGLARLELGDDEAAALVSDLNGILEHMETLGDAALELPEEGGEAHREGGAPLRDGRSDRPDRLLRKPEDFAPEWEDGFFVVPRLPAVEGGEDDVEGRAP